MKSKKEVYGSIRFSYDTLVMPLEVAHKVQALLAEHAVKVDQIYAKPYVFCTRPWEMSAVEVTKAPDFDCTDMNSKDYETWATAVREREEGAPIMDPKDFALLRGGE